MWFWSDENRWLRTLTTGRPDGPDREEDKAMVTVIFFGTMLLGISFMGLWSGRHDRRRGGKLQKAPVYRRPGRRLKNWPGV